MFLVSLQIPSMYDRYPAAWKCPEYKGDQSYDQAAYKYIHYIALSGLSISLNRVGCDYSNFLFDLNFIYNK